LASKRRPAVRRVGLVNGSINQLIPCDGRQAYHLAMFEWLISARRIRQLAVWS
jgi:hypothetical protein